MIPSLDPQFVLAAIALGSAFAVVLLILLIFLLVLGSRLSSLLRLMKLLPRISPALDAMAKAFDLAALGVESAGSAAKSAGQFLQTSESTLDGLQVPGSGSLQTGSLWDYVSPLPALISLGGLPDVHVLTGVNLSTGPLFPNGSSLGGAGNKVVDIGTKLGLQPSQPGTLSGELHDAAKLCRDLARLVNSVNP